MSPGFSWNFLTPEDVGPRRRFKFVLRFFCFPFALGPPYDSLHSPRRRPFLFWICRGLMTIPGSFSSTDIMEFFLARFDLPPDEEMSYALWKAVFPKAPLMYVGVIFIKCVPNHLSSPLLPPPLGKKSSIPVN